MSFIRTTGTSFGMGRGPAVQVYPLREIAQQTDNFNLNFGLDPALDRVTPQTALMTANEIQQHATRGHPIRVAAFEFLSENAYANQEFSQLVWVIMNRIGHGILNGEFRTIQQGQQECIPIICRAWAGGFTCFNQELYNQVATSQEIVNSLSADSQLWEYCLALASGTVQWTPFKKNTGIPHTPSSIKNNSSVAIGETGAFVEARQHQPVRHDNNTIVSNRYSRIRDSMLAEQQAQMQSSAQQSQQTPSRGFGARSLMQQTQVQQPVQPVQEPVPQQQATEEPAAAIATLKIAGQDVEIIRPLADGAKLWKPTAIQPFLPAYCARTHCLSFLQTRNHGVLGVIVSISKESRKVLMNYEDHAIDPNMGRPLENAKPKPVRPEAKILYATSEELKVNVIVKPNPTMVDSFESAVTSTITHARRISKGDEPVVCSSIINTPIVFKTKEEAEETYDALLRIGTAKTLKEAGLLFDRITDPQILTILNEKMEVEVTSLLQNELLIAGASVSEAVQTYSNELEDTLRGMETEETDYVKLFQAGIQKVLKQITRSIMAKDARDYADFVLADGDKETADDEVVERTIILQRNVNVVYMPFTKNELAIRLPETGVAHLDRESLPLLSKSVDAMAEKAALNASLMPEQFIVTSDGKLFEAFRGNSRIKGFLLRAA